MADRSSLGPAEAVGLLTEITGEPYALTGRLSGGETGAHGVRHAPTGRRFVLKWETDEHSQGLRREAVILTERLRNEAGWPVPVQRTLAAQGCLLVLQEHMPGQPVEVFGEGVVEEVLGLHARRLGLARSEDPSHWPAALIETLIVGGRGYCLHESLRGYDERTARLVAGVEAFATSLDPGDLAGGDIVHWDLHPGNLLGAAGLLTAVVDTDFACVGDAAFDLVMLAVTSLALPCGPGVRRRLFAAAFDSLDEVRARAYLGHLFIRLLDWPIRRGRTEEIEFWLAAAENLRGFQ